MATGIMTTITQKGQVTIPKYIREMLSLGLRSKVFIEPADGYVKVIPTEDILDLAGTFKPKKKKPVMEARNYMAKNYKRF